MRLFEDVTSFGINSGVVKIILYKFYEKDERF